MKKFFKVFGIVTLILWVGLTTLFTYIFFRNSWKDFLAEDAKYEIPNFIFDDPVTIEDGELQFDEYLSKTQFADRIENIQESNFMDLLMYSEGLIVLEPTIETDQIISNFKTIYERWPEQLKEFCESNIYKVLIVNNLESNGRAISLNQSSGFIILIDESLLLKAPNDWATEEESKTFFNDDDSRILNVVIENKDDPALTLENVLIHEIGHAFGVRSGLTPDFRRTIPMENKYPFFNESFEKYVVDFVRKKETDHLYDRVSYSLPSPELTLQDYIDLLEQLNETSFPTMYSSKNELELFAEIFYSYVHCVLQNKPYRYEVLDSDGAVITYPNGINEPRCAYERSFIEEYFKTESNRPLDSHH